jgi:hypothetical protein
MVFAGLQIGMAQVAQQPPSVAGTWKGVLEAARLTVVFNIAATPDGKLTATMDSPDQGATGIPVSQVIFADSVLKITVAAVQGSYEGRLGGDGRIKGEWRQGAAALPLLLEKVPPPAKTPEPKARLSAR